MLSVTSVGLTSSLKKATLRHKLITTIPVINPKIHSGEEGDDTDLPCSDTPTRKMIGDRNWHQPPEGTPPPPPPPPPPQDKTWITSPTQTASAPTNGHPPAPQCAHSTAQTADQMTPPPSTHVRRRTKEKNGGRGGSVNGSTSGNKRKRRSGQGKRRPYCMDQTMQNFRTFCNQVRKVCIQTHYVKMVIISTIILLIHN